MNHCINRYRSCGIRTVLPLWNHISCKQTPVVKKPSSSWQKVGIKLQLSYSFDMLMIKFANLVYLNIQNRRQTVFTIIIHTHYIFWTTDIRLNGLGIHFKCQLTFRTQNGAHIGVKLMQVIHPTQAIMGLHLPYSTKQTRYTDCFE